MTVATISPTIEDIYRASKSRMQFHHLLLHLCKIIRKFFEPFYLAPRGSPVYLSYREKWNTLQGVIDDLHELRACIPEHLRVNKIDEQVHEEYRQQTIFLELLIEYTIILAHRPLAGYRKSPHDPSETEPLEQVAITRQELCRQTSLQAAYETCNMAAKNLDKNLSLTILLVLSAWGIYTSAAEIVALHALRSHDHDHDNSATDALDHLHNMLQFLERLERRSPFVKQDCSILRGLVRTVRVKVGCESVPSSNLESEVGVIEGREPASHESYQRKNEDFSRGQNDITESDSIGMQWLNNLMDHDCGNLGSIGYNNLEFTDFDFSAW